MTNLDHQQAAIDEVVEILHDWFGCSPGGEASPGCECDPEPYESDAEHILTAATPHLRAAWEQPIRELHRPEPFHDEPTKFFCQECQTGGTGEYPCPTIQIIKREEQ